MYLYIPEAAAGLHADNRRSALDAEPVSESNPINQLVTSQGAWRWSQ